MEQIKDLNIYNQRMNQSIDDKLFFIKLLEDSDINVIVDYGCGDGNLIKNIYNNFKDKNYILIGYDNNVDMIDLARDNLKHTSLLNVSIFLYSSFEDVLQLIKGIDGTKLINFSSVIHEMQTYSSLLKEFLRIFSVNYKLHNYFNYVTIRDMSLYIDERKKINFLELLNKAKKT